MSNTWYSINIKDNILHHFVFDGFFYTNTSNHVVSFYETIDNNTIFSDNILYSQGVVFLDSQHSPNEAISITSMSNYNATTTAGSNYNLEGSESGSSLKGQISGRTNVDVKYTITKLKSEPSCFNQGTKILFLNKKLEEEYICVENLRRGDLVKSYKHGYRKIDLIGKNFMVNNPDHFGVCMYKMEKTPDNGLIEDLIVTGGHSILIDDLGDYKKETDEIFGSNPMIDDKYLLLAALSKDFTKLDNTHPYIYYHFILENNGDNDERFGVWANGVLTETPSNNQFTHHKYTLL